MYTFVPQIRKFLLLVVNWITDTTITWEIGSLEIQFDWRFELTTTLENLDVTKFKVMVTGEESAGIVLKVEVILVLLEE